MASTATATVELVSASAARGGDIHSIVAIGGGADVPDIPEVVSEQSSAAMPRPHARHTLVGVEVQDVFEDDTGVAETPRHLVGGSDGGHGHVGVQTFGMMARGIAGAARAGRPSGASRGRVSRLGVLFSGAAAVERGPDRPDRREGSAGGDGAGHGGALDGMQGRDAPAQARREGIGVKRGWSDTERGPVRRGGLAAK